MRICDEPRPVKVEPILFIQIGFIHTDPQHLGQKHDVTAQFSGFRYPALNIDRAFLDDRGKLQVLCLSRRQPRLPELVHIPAGTYTAVICGIRQLLRSQVDDKLSRFP